jgi:type I restriction enzyme, R subunit
MLAFTGAKKVDGNEHTEDSLNGFAEKDQRSKFDSDEYRILVVANKYLTGFDQRKLTAMYVDKKLQGVLAVQALSRLNRASKAHGKRTEDLFILDFFNTTEEIEKAFEPYYTSTTLSHATDVNVLHELKSSLDAVGVYEWEEVEELANRFFKSLPADQLSPLVDVAAERFNQTLDLEDKEKADFKIKAKQFVKIYGQMAAIIPFEVPKWEMLFWFLKFLIPKLIVHDALSDAIDELLQSVDLSTYGLERTKLGHTIVLDATESELDPQNPNPRGAHGDEEELDPLDLIIASFNEKWFKGWAATPDEQRVKFVAIAKHVQQDPKFEKQFVNNPDTQNRELVLIDMINEAISKQRRNELEMYKLYSQDPSFRQAMLDTVRRMLSI